MKKFDLPVDYTKLSPQDRRLVRLQYIEEQNNLCMYCDNNIHKPPPIEILTKKINWGLFPDNFLKYPVHLQHCHKTGLTEGAVHAYCNAIMWQYHNR